MRTIFIIMTVLLSFSCQDTRVDYVGDLGSKESIAELDFEEELEMEPPRSMQPQRPPNGAESIDDKIIKTGSIEFEVSDVETSKKRIKSLLFKEGGVIESETYNTYRNRKVYSFILRVPSDNFDKTIDSFEEGIGDMKSKSINARNVTEEYVDLGIRLENNLSYLNQYKEVLKKAKSIKEILEVKEKIRKIETEIESKKGRLKYLNNQASLSTINLEISQLESIKVENRKGFGTRLGNSFSKGVDLLLDVIIGIIQLWPFILLLFLVMFLFKPVLKKLRKTKS